MWKSKLITSTDLDDSPPSDYPKLLNTASDVNTGKKKMHKHTEKNKSYYFLVCVQAAGGCVPSTKEKKIYSLLQDY